MTDFVSVLKAIAEDTVSPSQMSYVHEDELGDLVDLGYVECNVLQRSPNDPNKIAVRATRAGLDYYNGLTRYAEEPSKQGENVTDFKIDNGVELVSAYSGYKSKYPIHDLEIGQSFFVPASEKMKKPWISLASTVSNAKRRFAVPTGEFKTKSRFNKNTGQTEERQVELLKYQRDFKIRKVIENGVEGARVWRVELK